MVLIASYNIRKAIASDRRRRPERILDVLSEIGADVVLLQEADRRFGSRESALPAHMLAEHGYRVAAVSRRMGSIGWHGNAILLRDGAVTVDRCTILHLPSLEPRGAVLADLSIGRHRLRVVGMHLDLSGLWRRRQAHAILRALEEQPDRLPTLLAGDLNEWRRAQGCLHDFAVHYDQLDLGPSFHARRPIGRLDRMFVQGVAVEACGVHHSLLARSASDHLPIWARLAPGGRGA